MRNIIFLVSLFSLKLIEAQSCGIEQIPPFSADRLNLKRIINGNIAPDSNWPWVVTINRYFSAGSVSKSHCAGIF